MNETSKKGSGRFRVFSLRSFLIAVGFVGFILSVLAFQMRRYNRNNFAITEIRRAGVPVYVTDSRNYCMDSTEVNAADLLSVLSFQPALAALVDFSDPSLTKDEIRKLLPDLQALIPSCSYESDKCYIAIELSGNPNVSVDLVDELRAQLPDFRFVQYTPVPPESRDAVKIGMAQYEVIETIGNLIYDQRSDWPDEKTPTVKMLGSQMNIKYQNAKGTETWTYFTDNVGVGVLGIEFDLNGDVAEVWTDRGITENRKLTKIETMIGGL